MTGANSKALHRRHRGRPRMAGAGRLLACFEKQDPVIVEVKRAHFVTCVHFYTEPRNAVPGSESSHGDFAIGIKRRATLHLLRPRGGSNAAANGKNNKRPAGRVGIDPASGRPEGPHGRVAPPLILRQGHKSRQGLSQRTKAASSAALTVYYLPCPPSRGRGGGDDGVRGSRAGRLHRRSGQ